MGECDLFLDGLDRLFFKEATACFKAFVNFRTLINLCFLSESFAPSTFAQFCKLASRTPDGSNNLLLAMLADSVDLSIFND